MNFKEWLRDAYGPESRAARAAHRRNKRRPSLRRLAPRIEDLEARRVLATLIVNTSADNQTTGDHELTLREAFLSVNQGSLVDSSTAAQVTGAFGTNDTIQFDSSIDGQSILLSSAISTNYGPAAFALSNGHSLTIDGETGLTDGITIAPSASTPFRIFYVDSLGNLTLKGLTLSGGYALGGNGGSGDMKTTGGGGAGLGGAIFNQGHLTILDSTLTGNTAQGGAGGNSFPIGGYDAKGAPIRLNNDSGSGGGGMGGSGEAPGGSEGSGDGGHGGGPNGGNAGDNLYPSGKAGGVGGGGGGGTTTAISFFYGEGGNGGFGGGGGGGNEADIVAGNVGTNGGNGGFGGGGGGASPGSGGFPGQNTAGTPGAGGFGGGGAIGQMGGGGGGMGGAIFNDSGIVVITNSTIAVNSAIGGAGGKLTGGGSGAPGSGLGGGLFSRNGTITITNSTIAENTAQLGTGVYDLGDGSTATATITNTIVSQGAVVTPGTFDLVIDTTAGGSTTANGHANLIGDVGHGLVNVTNNMTAPLTGNPLLGPLQDNGGWSPTMALLSGSPAIQQGDESAAPATDQRGYERDIGHTGNVDIGAFEHLSAVEITVNTTADSLTDSDDSTLSLREAIDLLNGSIGIGTLSAAERHQVKNIAGSVNSIDFASNLDGDTIYLSAVGDNSAGPSAFQINNQVVISGPTGDSGVGIAVAPGTAMRLFDVLGTGDLTLQNLTISGGTAQGGDGGDSDSGGAGGGGAGLGGAIFNQGRLTISNSTLTGNTALGGQGGTAGTSDRYGQGRGNAGSGGGGLGTDGENSSLFSVAAGGGPGGGNAGTASARNGGDGAPFGGGGGGGFGNTPNGPGTAHPGKGGNGGFGAGGGGGGYYGIYNHLSGGAGGNGGFGGGGGSSGGQGALSGSGGYGGGVGGYLSHTGGGGAGMGGAIFNEAGTVIITNSTFAENTARGGTGGDAPFLVSGHGAGGKGLGGGIFNHNGILTITNSTLSDNDVVQGDGSTLVAAGRNIFNLGDSTFSTDGGNQAIAAIINTILGQTNTDVEDFTGKNFGSFGKSVTLGENNLIRTQSGFFDPISNTEGVVSHNDPLLGLLQDNGGPTQTMALLAGSPAIDAGAFSSTVVTDQRGVVRDADRDIGAYEVRIAFNMVVTTDADEATDSDDSTLSLREAMDLANGTLIRSSLSDAEKALVTPVPGTVNTISFASDLNGETIALSAVGDTRVGPSAFLVNSAVDIAGPTGNSGVKLSAAGTTMRLFDVTTGGNLTLQNLTLSGGTAQGFAGGDSAYGNSGGGSAGLGGAIFNQGSLAIINSTLTGNTAQGGAGGNVDTSLSGFGGAGGAGLNGNGAKPASDGTNNGGAGGGPNGGAGGTSSTKNGAGGDFGGGGGGGLGGGYTSLGGNGGTGGFGGGGGGGGLPLGLGGQGGFGGGGGSSSGYNLPPVAGGYGGGQSGGYPIDAFAYSAGGGGAGMGGAIFNEAGKVIITNSTFALNSAVGGAGGTGNNGLNNGDAGKALGGALFNHNGIITVISSTVAANIAADGGRGIFNLGDSEFATTDSVTGKLTVTNSIVAQSDADEEDLTSKTNSAGVIDATSVNSLIRTHSGIGGTFVTPADPKLDNLGDNGGPTQTMALRSGSPAIDAALDPGEDTDQRGFPRVGVQDLGAFEVGAVEIQGARVLSLSVASTNWLPAYFDTLHNLGLGDGGYNIPVGSSAQLSDLPWINLNQIRIAFNAGVNVQKDSLQLSGVNVESYSITGFAYNPATHIATWTLSAPISTDRLQIHLASTGPAAVTDLDGNPLDGEWTDQESTYPSGDGQPGGEFNFAFNVLPGDVNQDGIVNIGDLTYIGSHWLTPGSSGDINGDNIVNLGEQTGIGSNWLHKLPPAGTGASNSLAEGSGTIDSLLPQQLSEHATSVVATATAENETVTPVQSLATSTVTTPVVSATLDVSTITSTASAKMLPQFGVSGTAIAPLQSFDRVAAFVGRANATVDALFQQAGEEDWKYNPPTVPTLGRPQYDSPNRRLEQDLSTIAAVLDDSLSTVDDELLATLTDAGN